MTSKIALTLVAALALSGCTSKPKEVEAFGDTNRPVYAACLVRKDIKPELCSCIDKQARAMTDQKSQSALAGYMLMTSREEMGKEFFKNRNAWRATMQNSMHYCSSFDEENDEDFFGLIY